MRTKKTTSGSRCLLALLVCGLLCSVAVPGKDRKKGKTEPEVYAVIAGTVFRSDGFALGGAEIAVAPSADPDSQDNLKQAKKLRAIANSRGEFAVRVPAVPMKYRIDVKMQGFQPQVKDVSIEGEQRKELNFLLEAAK